MVEAMRNLERATEDGQEHIDMVEVNNQNGGSSVIKRC